MDAQRMHAQCMHIHQTEVITTMSLSPQAGLAKIIKQRLAHAILWADKHTTEEHSKAQSYNE